MGNCTTLVQQGDLIAPQKKETIGRCNLKPAQYDKPEALGKHGITDAQWDEVNFAMAGAFKQILGSIVMYSCLTGALCWVLTSTTKIYGFWALAESILGVSAVIRAVVIGRTVSHLNQKIFIQKDMQLTFGHMGCFSAESQLIISPLGESVITVTGDSCP
mmetsp:Transcript_94753/g.237678  ORF Transcript_94753/g.237678 Transcript_94753/m.237678 type:complete len:160 (-) Transcript_94753:83-562(-)